MIRVLVSGAGGRMGGRLGRALAATPDLALGAALEAKGHPRLGEELSPGVRIGDDVGAAFEGIGVAIDFSAPAGTLALVAEASRRRVPAVIGTTGFSEPDLARLRAMAEAIPMVLSANFSLGVTAMLALVAEAARRLPDYEIELLELHHSAKLDAPSGTALRLAEAAAAARGVRLEDVAVYHREGHTGPRPTAAIGIQSLRAGDSVGEHTFYLAGPGERLEISHRALSRDNFAQGALRAARWLISRPPGLYSMTDVLR
jgi:4-hydroxy-tetrahydrodipicolinate reductase